MIPQYTTWRRSSHAQAATCVDCHVPHDNIFHKYEFKIKDGLRHATIFTLRKEPQVIHIKKAGEEVVFNNCLHCHEDVLQDVSIHEATYQDYEGEDVRLCWECHREVPHGRVRSLSATPYALIPEDRPKVPGWVERFLSVIEQYQRGEE